MKVWKSLFKTIPSWEFVGSRNKEYYRPGLQLPTCYGYQSCCCLHHEGRWRAPCVGLLVWVYSLQKPSLHWDELVSNQTGGQALCAVSCLEAQSIALPQRSPEPSLSSDISLVLQECLGVLVLTHPIAIEIFSKWRIMLSAATLEFSTCPPVFTSLSSKVKLQSLSYAQCPPFVGEPHWVMDRYTYTPIHI